MAEKKLRIPPMEIRLAPSDQLRFDHYAASLGKTKTEMAREAVRYWLDHQDKQINDDRESKLEARIRKMEDRLAAMIMRGTIDTGVLYQAIYYNFGADAEKAFMSFYNQSVKRLKFKRKDQADKTTVMGLVDDLYRKGEAKREGGEKPEPEQA